MAAWCEPSAEYASVVSRTGITSRISLNGALAGSGGIIVSSMKSYSSGGVQRVKGEEKGMGGKGCVVSVACGAVEQTAGITHPDAQPARFEAADLDVSVDANFAVEAEPVGTVALQAQPGARNSIRTR